MSSLCGCASVREVSSQHVSWFPDNDRPSEPTVQIIALLQIDDCRSNWARCATAIEQNLSSLPPAVRVLTVAEAWHWAARQGDGRHPSQTLSCMRGAYRYLFDVGLEGRSPPSAEPTMRAQRLYNSCLRLWMRDALPTFSPTTETVTWGGTTAIEWHVREPFFPAQSVGRLLTTANATTIRVNTHQSQDNIGIPLVADTRESKRQASTLPWPRLLAVSALLRFAANDEPPVLELHDPYDSPKAQTVHGPVSLAADFTAALSITAKSMPGSISSALQLTRVRDDITPQIEMLQPYDPERIPVILIHGLASSPRTWLDLGTDLLGDPRLARHYQVWLCRYSSSEPTLANRLLVEQTLDKMLRTLDPELADVGPQHVVLVGHSMGGVIARLLATNSGSSIWDAAFTIPPEELTASEEDRRIAKEVFIFDAWAPATRVVLVATPNQGAPLAQGLRGRLARSLMKVPADALLFLVNLATENPEQVQRTLRDNYRLGGPKSIDVLAPDQPVTAAGARVPVATGVAVNTIIGIRDTQHPERGDGIVPLASAEWPGAESTKRIVAGHNVHQQAEAILEIKRILLLHAGLTSELQP